MVISITGGRLVIWNYRCAQAKPISHPDGKIIYWRFMANQGHGTPQHQQQSKTGKTWMTVAAPSCPLVLLYGPLMETPAVKVSKSVKLLLGVFIPKYSCKYTVSPIYRL